MYSSSTSGLQKPQNLPGAAPVSNNWLPQASKQIPGMGYVAGPKPAPKPTAQASSRPTGYRPPKPATYKPPSQTPQQTAYAQQLAKMLGNVQPGTAAGGNTTGSFVAPQIDVNPIWNQQQVTQAQQGMRNTPAPPMNTSGAGAASQAGISQMLQDSMMGAGSAAATNFGRDAAFANSQHIMNANQHNVARGLDAANLGASQYANQLGFDNGYQNILLSMLGGLV